MHILPFVGERRIRVHTLCLPVTNQLSEIYAGADQQAIIGLLAKMGKNTRIGQSTFFNVHNHVHMYNGST